MSTEILEEFSASNDQMILKRKRTKRPRQSSASSSGGDSNSNSLLSSPATSTSTQEDQDLANCLILLARGGSGPQPGRAESKFSSRKFAEVAATNAGKVGMYVYECKTCSRSFPSFQALGGHRASHKKPKSAADFDQNKPAAAPENQEKEEIEVNKPKIHECSICGSEFSSGQALGGHMRRHRSGPAAVERSAADFSRHDDHRVVEKTRNMLALDLNMPAQPEEERCEAKFRAFSSNQRPRLVFAAAALVDCHY